MVTGPLFSGYLTSELEDALCGYCAKENLALKIMDKKNMSVTEFWEDFFIRDAIMLLDESWAAVTHLYKVVQI